MQSPCFLLSCKRPVSVRGIWRSVGDDPVARCTIVGAGDHCSAISQSAPPRSSRARVGERKNKNGAIPLIVQSRSAREVKRPVSVRGIWRSVGDDPVARCTIVGAGDHCSAISQSAPPRSSRARVGERKNKNGAIPLIVQSRSAREVKRPVSVRGIWRSVGDDPVARAPSSVPATIVRPSARARRRAPRARV